MSKIILLAHKEHHLHALLSKSPYYQDADDEELLSDILIELPKNTVIFDFTVGSTEEKRVLIEHAQEEGANIYADLTSCWAAALMDTYKNLKGCFASAIFSPTNTYEVAVKKPESLTEMQNVFESLGLQAKLVEDPGIGFTFSRIIAQIINEAAFSLEDALASSQDIDKAMRFGVNYPLGPFEWLEKSGPAPIVHLLDELYAVSGEARYRCATSLRKKLL